MSVYSLSLLLFSREVIFLLLGVGIPFLRYLLFCRFNGTRPHFVSFSFFFLVLDYLKIVLGDCFLAIFRAVKYSSRVSSVYFSVEFFFLVFSRLVYCIFFVDFSNCVDKGTLQGQGWVTNLAVSVEKKEDTYKLAGLVIVQFIGASLNNEFNHKLILVHAKF